MLRWSIDGPGRRIALVGTYTLRGTTLCFDEWYVINRVPHTKAYEAQREVIAFDGIVRVVTWRGIRRGKMRDARQDAENHRRQVDQGAQRW